MAKNCMDLKQITEEKKRRTQGIERLTTGEEAQLRIFIRDEFDRRGWPDDLVFIEQILQIFGEQLYEKQGLLPEYTFKTGEAVTWEYRQKRTMLIMDLWYEMEGEDYIRVWKPFRNPKKHRFTPSCYDMDGEPDERSFEEYLLDTMVTWPDLPPI